MPAENLASDPELQAIAAFAAEALGAPVALLSALGEDRQRFLAQVGFDRAQTPLEDSFCLHTLRSEGLFEVRDATLDPRFAGNPLVTGGPRVRFYAGAPVVPSNGVSRGALCVLDTQPRTLTDDQRRTLAFLARQAEGRLELLERIHEAERSASLLGLVTDRLPVGVAYVDRGFRFRFMNDAYERNARLSRERAVGRTIAEAANERVFQTVRANLERALGGETHTDEFDAPYDGGVRRVAATYVPDLPPEGGPARGVVVQIVDLTEQRAAERAVQREREHLDRTLRMAEVATFDWDVPNDRVHTNDLMAAFYGMPNSPEGRPVALFYESVHPEDRAPLAAAIEASLATGRRYEAQYRVRGEGGRERWVLARGDTVRDGDGRPLRLSGVLLDVSERVEAETARQESEGRLRVALRGGRMGTWDIDLGSGTMVCSDTCKANYGRRSDEPFSYEALARAVLQEDRSRWTRTVERAIARGEEFEMEYRVHWPDGTPHWVQVRGGCVFDVEGRVVGLSGVSFDVTARAEAEAERERLLAEVETERAKLRAIFEQAPAIIAVLRGRELVFDYVNQGCYQLTGQRPMLGLTFEQALPEAVGGGEGRDYDRVLGRVFDTGERISYVERPVILQRAPGGPTEERFLDLAYLPLREADGTVSGVLVHGVDVTEGVVARKAIREREELLRTVFEQAPDDAILVMDLDRTLTAWNPAAERMTGWTAAEAVGQPADLIFTPEDRLLEAPAQETTGAALHGKAEDERWHMRRDGSRFWGSGTMNALHNAEGDVTGFLKVFRDATAQYEETRGLTFLADLTEAIMLGRHEDDVILTCERMLGEYLGVSRVSFSQTNEAGTQVIVEYEWSPGLPSLVGTYTIADYGPDVEADYRAGRPHVSRDAALDYAPGAGLEAVLAVGARSGVTVPILREGRFAALLVVHHREPRDWTQAEIVLVRQAADRMLIEAERARAEAALREANRTLEARVDERTRELVQRGRELEEQTLRLEVQTVELETQTEELAARSVELQRAVQEAEGFNYSISHDLRTPLRAVVMTSSVLLEEAGPELDEEHRDLLRRQVHNANRMGQLIDELLRLSRLARAEVNRRPFDMTAEARAVAEAIETDCTVEVQEGMRAEGDAGLVRTVLVNLLENACKFSVAGGTVRVGKADGAFFVRDEGVGFDMKFAPKIFLPFERLVTEREFPGTGIGLANVKRIVERHGGRVWAESEPGKGATFFFTLAPSPQSPIR